MKKKITKYFLSFLGAISAALAGLTLYQQIVLKIARKKADDTHFMETWETEEGLIHYRSIGKGKPILLIHSIMLGASCREWDAVAESLAENYHVYAIDLPGFGKSFYPEKPWTAYQYTQLLHKFIEAVIKRPVCVCGANGGADFALLLSMLHPAQARRLVLISPEGIGKSFATNADTKQLPLLLSPVAGTQKFLLGTSKAAIRRELETHFYGKENISASLLQQYFNAARCGEHAQATFAGISTRFYAADTKAAFAKLSIPFLMIWGEENKISSSAHFTAAEKMKDFGSFALFEKTASLPHIENSRAFLEHITEFLK